MTTGHPDQDVATRLDAALIDQTVPPGSLRYFALLYAPADKRNVLIALHVLEDELSVTARNTHHEVAHTRLKWWQEELDRLVLGKPAHPATRALTELQAGFGAEIPKLKGLVDTAAMDLARVTFADEAELAGYFDRAGGTLAELATRWLLAPSSATPTTLQAAVRLGSLFKAVEALRDLRLNAQAGRIHISLAALDAAAIDVRELSRTPWPLGLQELLQSTRSTLETDIRKAAATIVGPNRAALRPMLVTASLYVRLLDRVARQIPASQSARPELHPFEKLFVSWRAARSAR